MTARPFPVVWRRDLDAAKAEADRLAGHLFRALAQLDGANTQVAALTDRLARHNARGPGGRFAPRPRHAAPRSTSKAAEALPQPDEVMVPGAGGSAAAAPGTAQPHADRGAAYDPDAMADEPGWVDSSSSQAYREQSEALLARLHGIPAAEFGDDAARSRAAADAADEAGHVDRAQWMDAFVEAYVCDDDEDPRTAAEFAWDNRA